MDYIFVTSKHGVSLEQFRSISLKAVSSCVLKNVDGGGSALSRSIYLTPTGARLLCCYGTSTTVYSLRKNAEEGTAALFHGYLLDRPDAGDSELSLRPEVNYYGVYSHGFVSDSDCYFATDEIGLSPLYYSEKEEYIYVSNNPHLIALYQRRAGARARVEPELPLWHTVGITIESDRTGYDGIYRVRPWRYLALDRSGNLSFPSKQRASVGSCYREAIQASLDELRRGMQTILRYESKLEEQLTGGLDSRLVLSLILDADAENRFLFTTKGTRDNPDFKAARILAQHYGLRHKRLRDERVRRNRRRLESFVERSCWENAMESSLVRLDGRQHSASDAVVLNGFGAVFSKSLWYAASFRRFMEKRFPSSPIDYDNLTDEQIAYGPECFGFSKEDTLYLTDRAIDRCLEYRRYIMDFNLERFPDNMNYADSLGAYRYRTHNANLANKDNNCILLYTPTTLEASRLLSPELRHEGKLFFDLMWEIKKELCFFPYENRTYNPVLYEDFSDEDKQLLNRVPSVKGEITSSAQKDLYAALLPLMRRDLLDMLPATVFDYVKREVIESQLKRDIPFGKPVFALVNLYGIAVWSNMVDQVNSASF